MLSENNQIDSQALAKVKSSVKDKCINERIITKARIGQQTHAYAWLMCNIRTFVFIQNENLRLVKSRWGKINTDFTYFLFNQTESISQL